MNYVKFYKKQTGSDFDSKKFEVHHIDEDRTNNHINNLVMLPKKLHQQYHTASYGVSDIRIDTMITSIVYGNTRSNNCKINHLEDFISIWSECCKWCDYRNYLLGDIPNIHKIKITEKVEK